MTMGWTLSEALAQALATALWLATGEETSEAFLVLDAAQSPEIVAGLRRMVRDVDVVSLYNGVAAVELAAVAPYLAPVLQGGDVFGWFVHAGWGRSWGYLVTSAVSLGALREHFRRLARVKTDDGRVLLFRYHDPRILRAFLGVADALQTAELFGPIDRIVVETDGGVELEVLSHQGGVLRAERRVAAPRAPATAGA